MNSIKHKNEPTIKKQNMQSRTELTPEILKKNVRLVKKECVVMCHIPKNHLS